VDLVAVAAELSTQDPAQVGLVVDHQDLLRFTQHGSGFCGSSQRKASNPLRGFRSAVFAPDRWPNLLIKPSSPLC